MLHLKPFQNNYREHDFSLIYETIKTYYPISEATRYTNKDIKSAPGFKRIGVLINDNFINEKNYKEKWNELNQSLERTLKKPIYAYPDLSGPCYSGAVMLEEVKTADFVWTKELLFYISLIGPFFSMASDMIQNSCHRLVPVSDRRQHSMALSMSLIHDQVRRSGVRGDGLVLRRYQGFLRSWMNPLSHRWFGLDEESFS